MKPFLQFIPALFIGFLGVALQLSQYRSGPLSIVISLLALALVAIPGTLLLAGGRDEQGVRIPRFFWRWRSDFRGHGWLPVVRLMLLRDAARLAYERGVRSKSDALTFARTNYVDSAKPLRWYANAILNQWEKGVPFYGVREPSRCFERISDDFVGQCGVSDDANEIFDVWQKSDRYRNVQLKRRDACRLITDINRWK